MYPDKRLKTLIQLLIQYYKPREQEPKPNYKIRTLAYCAIFMTKIKHTRTVRCMKAIHVSFSS